MKKDDMKVWVVVLAAAICVGAFILVYFRKPQSDESYTAVVCYVNPKTKARQDFKVKRFIAQGRGWVRFETPSGQIWRFEGPNIYRED